MLQNLRSRWLLDCVMAGWLASSAWGCFPKTPALPSTTRSDAGISTDAGSPNTGLRCPAGFNLCEHTCCSAGMNCVAGSCQYPYSSAHLYVYLCPSFNQGCSASFFGLDQMCSPINGGQPGTCYDTGFEIAGGRTYGIAGCQACGSNCGSPTSFHTPPGFLSPSYYSGVTWYCNTPCDAPPECSGGVGSGVALCSTMDCWLKALSIKENAESVPLLTVKQPSPPAPGASSSGQAPEITKINGMTVGSSTVIELSSLRQTTDEVELEYEFTDPSGCTPGVCFSMPSCPKGVQCSAGSTTACSRPKADGARAGSVILSLGFKAEPVDATTAPQLPLQVQPIVGPIDPATGDCGDPFDDSNPSAPTFVPGAVLGDPVNVDAVVIGPRAPGGVNPGGTGGTSGGTGGTSGGAGGASGTAGPDCTCHCADGRVCSANVTCGVDADGIPNPCGCPVGPPCH